MSDFSRRDFLRRSAGLAAVAGASLVPGVAAVAERLKPSNLSVPDLTFPTKKHDRIAVASWPFRMYMESPFNTEYRDPKLKGMDLTEFPAHVRDQFGVHNIEPLSMHFRSTDPDYLQKFRSAVEKAGSHIVDIPMGGQESYYDADPEVRKKAVELGKKWVDVAVAVGSPSIRNHIGGAKNSAPKVEVTAEGLKQVAEYGASKSVIVNLENDDLTSEDAFFIVKVVEKVNSPWLRALPDFCNSMMGGNADFNYRAVAAMFRHAYNICHVKDSEVGDKGKVERVDMPKTFGILKASGFRGYCSMEWEGAGDPYHGTQQLIAATRKYL